MPVLANPLSISVRADNGAIVAAIAGELDLATASVVKESVRPFWGRSDRVVYELGGVSFIDSAGIESLFNALENGETIAFKNPSKPVRRIIELLELEATIEETTIAS